MSVVQGSQSQTTPGNQFPHATTIGRCPDKLYYHYQLPSDHMYRHTQGVLLNTINPNLINECYSYEHIVVYILNVVKNRKQSTSKNLGNELK